MKTNRTYIGKEYSENDLLAHNGNAPNGALVARSAAAVPPRVLAIFPVANPGATSCVLKSLPWQLGDVIFTFSIDYDATKNAVQLRTQYTG